MGNVGENGDNIDDCGVYGRFLVISINVGNHWDCMLAIIVCGRVPLGFLQPSCEQNAANPWIF